jgi:protoheme IX farnesyltransferase
MVQHNGQVDLPRGLNLTDLMVLFKVRIVFLLLLSALGGAFVAAHGVPSGGPLSLLMVTGALAAMGSSAINEYIERERDARMLRTRKRPFVSGAIARPEIVLAAAAGMIVLAVGIAFIFNPALAFFLALGAFIYVVIYTVWLKPRTSLNIVIGGAAGSCAVLSGSASVGAWNDPWAVVLALMLFFWTPIHFWALAIVYREDYARAGVPMLPVTTTPKTAAFWGLLHGLAAGACAVLLATSPDLGPIYSVPVGTATAVLIYQGYQLVRQPTTRRAWRLFHTSNIFLAIVLVFVVAASTFSALLVR